MLTAVSAIFSPVRDVEQTMEDIRFKNVATLSH